MDVTQVCFNELFLKKAHFRSSYEVTFLIKAVASRIVSKLVNLVGHVLSSSCSASFTPVGNLKLKTKGGIQQRAGKICRTYIQVGLFEFRFFKLIKSLISNACFIIS